MDTKKEFMEFGKSKLNQWKGMIEELELQLSLGKAEAKDAWEKESKNLKKFFRQQQAQFEKADAQNKDQRITLVRKLSELSSVLRKEEAKSKRSFDNFRKQTLKLIHEVEYMLREIISDSPERISRQLTALRNPLDVYRIQLALSEYDTRQKLSRPQNELEVVLDKTIQIIDRENNLDGNSVERFMEEISQSFNHLKHAFSEIL